MAGPADRSLDKSRSSTRAGARRAFARSVLVQAEAERVAGWVEEHPDILLRLVFSQRRSEGERLSSRRVEVAHLEVEVHHRTLFPGRGRPGRGLVVGCLLEHDVDGPLGRSEDGRSRFFMTDGPIE